MTKSAQIQVEVWVVVPVSNLKTLNVSIAGLSEVNRFLVNHRALSLERRLHGAVNKYPLCKCHVCGLWCRPRVSVGSRPLVSALCHLPPTGGAISWYFALQTAMGQRRKFQHVCVQTEKFAGLIQLPVLHWVRVARSKLPAAHLCDCAQCVSHLWIDELNRMQGRNQITCYLRRS